MKNSRLALLGVAATLALGACTTYEDDDDVYVAPAPPVGPGAVVGTVAADINGDGVIDGYYDANGRYIEWRAPPCPTYTPPPATPTRAGERG